MPFLWIAESSGRVLVRRVGASVVRRLALGKLLLPCRAFLLQLLLSLCALHSEFLLLGLLCRLLLLLLILLEFLG